jgi:toxin ParE1/3/4
VITFKYRLHPSAQDDYESSVSWYLKRSLKAATNFVNDIDRALAHICSDPKQNRNEYKNYYELSIHKYPFTIIYTVEEDLQTVIIVAIYHHKRKPGNKYR